MTDVASIHCVAIKAFDHHLHHDCHWKRPKLLAV
jgi:hypothetical protein